MEKKQGKLLFENGRYKYKESDSAELDQLICFFSDDIGSFGTSWFKEWSLDDNHEVTGGNYSYIEKEKGFVFVGCDFSEQEDGGPFFKISIENFVEILTQWDELYKTKPKEILIIQEDGGVRLEGKN